VFRNYFVGNQVTGEGTGQDSAEHQIDGLRQAHVELLQMRDAAPELLQTLHADAASALHAQDDDTAPLLQAQNDDTAPLLQRQDDEAESSLQILDADTVVQCSSFWHIQNGYCMPL